MAERYADGLIGAKEYKAAKQAVSRMARRERVEGGPDGPPRYGQVLLDFLGLRHLPGWAGDKPSLERADYLSNEVRQNREVMRGRGMEGITEQQAIECQRESDAFMEDHANLLREIFGNPLRPVYVNPAWLLWNNGTVAKFAKVIYEERAFDHLPILGDALEEASCTDQAILEHCRQRRPHVKGCWLLDLLLQKC